MDLSITDYQRQLKATAREFMERECPKDLLVELGKSDTGHDPAIWRKAAEVGFLGALVPEGHGGSGGSLTDAAMIFEEFGRGPLPGPYFSSAVLGNLVLQECGTDDQQAALLPGIASGEEAAVLALTEADYGWDAGTIDLQAEDQGDKFVLNGAKVVRPRRALSYEIPVRCPVRVRSLRREEYVSLWSTRTPKGFLGEQPRRVRRKRGRGSDSTRSRYPRRRGCQALRTPWQASNGPYCAPYRSCLRTRQAQLEKYSTSRSSTAGRESHSACPSAGFNESRIT